MTKPNTTLGILAVLTAACSFQVQGQNNYAPAGYSINNVKTPDNVLFAITGLDVEPDGDVGQVARRHRSVVSPDIADRFVA